MMFRRSSALLAAALAATQSLAVIGLMRRYNVRAFTSKWQELQFKAAARGPSYRGYSRMRPPTGNRESARRARQSAHQHQINCHKPGTVQPRHIFGAGQ